MRRRNAGMLELPTGELVACDPLTFLDTEPFDIAIEPGRYPVLLFVAELRDESRLAYAMLEVSRERTVRWKRADVQEDDVRRTLFDPPDGGYPVDSSVGSFMDAHTAGVLMNYTPLLEDDEFPRAIHGEMRRQQRQGFAWANLDIRQSLGIHSGQTLNLITFETGFGPGLYETWVGLDEKGRVTRVVSDFQVLDLHFRSFPM
ncbi:DUF4241 domain-containing protein [Bradymonas sediminis]|nr:DUF4241 domain-containing protein [Bradymonas sediminis]